MRWRWPHCCCLCCLVLLSANPLAAEQTTPASPGIELLEFLGEWETDDGEWVNPMSLYGDRIRAEVEAERYSETKGNRRPRQQ